MDEKADFCGEGGVPCQSQRKLVEPLGLLNAGTKAQIYKSIYQNTL